MLQPSVLLVEDDAFQRKAAETYLMNHDLRVIAVENGAQMRRQISRAMPDLVLLDVQLPGQEDGFALARWLRESNTKVGIIMLTAAGDSVDKVLGLESGADDYVAKPYEPRELLARCKSVLRRSANKSTPSLLERIRMGQYMLDLPKRQLLEGVCQSDALECRLKAEQRVADGQVALDLVLHQPAIHLEFPFVDHARAPKAEAHTVVTRQLIRMAGSRNPPQVLRRSDHRDGERPPEGDGNHIPLDALAYADTGIETSLDDVDEPLIVGEL